MKKKILIIFLLMIALLFQNVKAEEKIENIKSTIETNEKIDKDSFLLGNNVKVNGVINGIGFIAGNNIEIKGNLDYGFITGKSININGNIKNSLYLAGKNINLNKDSNIEKETFIIGENITLDGNFNKDIKIIGKNITIKENTKINNITINAEKIIIKENSNIKGTLKYNENANIKISNKDNINKIKQTKSITFEKNKTSDVLKSTLNLVITFAVLTITLPVVIEKTNILYKGIKVKNYLKNIGIGLLLLICTPLICILLLMSNIGISLGLILSAIYAIALYLSYIIAGYILGNLLLRKAFKFEINDILTGIIGIIILKLLILIPIIGAVITLLALTTGLSNIWNLVITDEK